MPAAVLRAWGDDKALGLEYHNPYGNEVVQPMEVPPRQSRL
jgi:hypothetical protein